MIRLEIKIACIIKKEAANISTLSSDKIDKYEYRTGEEILPSEQSRIIEQAMFTYSPLGKAFQKQIKTIEDQWIKQVTALKALKLEKKLTTINWRTFRKKMGNTPIFRALLE